MEVDIVVKSQTYIYDCLFFIKKNWILNVINTNNSLDNKFSSSFIFQIFFYIGVRGSNGYIYFSLTFNQNSSISLPHFNLISKVQKKKKS